MSKRESPQGESGFLGPPLAQDIQRETDSARSFFEKELRAELLNLDITYEKRRYPNADLPDTLVFTFSNPVSHRRAVELAVNIAPNGSLSSRERTEWRYIPQWHYRCPETGENYDLVWEEQERHWAVDKNWKKIDRISSKTRIILPERAK